MLKIIKLTLHNKINDNKHLIKAELFVIGVSNRATAILILIYCFKL